MPINSTLDEALVPRYHPYWNVLSFSVFFLSPKWDNVEKYKGKNKN